MANNSADLCDQANETADLILQVALKNHQNRQQDPPPKGSCYNCIEPLTTEQRFCDKDCREDWEKRNRRPR